MKEPTQREGCRCYPHSLDPFYFTWRVKLYCIRWKFFFHKACLSSPYLPRSSVTQHARTSRKRLRSESMCVLIQVFLSFDQMRAQVLILQAVLIVISPEVFDKIKWWNTREGEGQSLWFYCHLLLMGLVRIHGAFTKATSSHSVLLWSHFLSLLLLPWISRVDFAIDW